MALDSESTGLLDMLPSNPRFTTTDLLQTPYINANTSHGQLYNRNMAPMTDPMHNGYMSNVSVLLPLYATRSKC